MSLKVSDFHFSNNNDIQSCGAPGIDGCVWVQLFEGSDGFTGFIERKVCKHT